MLFFEAKDLAGGGGRGKHRWQTKKLLSLEVPEEMEALHPQIITDLIEAFTAYRGAGVFAEDEAEPYAFTLEH